MYRHVGKIIVHVYDNAIMIVSSNLIRIDLVLKIFGLEKISIDI